MSRPVTPTIKISEDRTDDHLNCQTNNEEQSFFTKLSRKSPAVGVISDFLGIQSPNESTSRRNSFINSKEEEDHKKYCSARRKSIPAYLGN